MMCFHHSVKESNSMSVVRQLHESKYIKHGFGEATFCGLHRLADLDADQHGLNPPAPSADGDPSRCWNLQQLLLLNRHRRGSTTTSVAICKKRQSLLQDTVLGNSNTASRDFGYKEAHLSWNATKWFSYSRLLWMRLGPEMFHFFDCISCKAIFREKADLLHHATTCDSLQFWYFK